MRITALVLLGLLTFGCSSGPDYEPLNPPPVDFVIPNPPPPYVPPAPTPGPVIPPYIPPYVPPVIDPPVVVDPPVDPPIVVDPPAPTPPDDVIGQRLFEIRERIRAGDAVAWRPFVDEFGAGIDGENPSSYHRDARVFHYIGTKNGIGIDYEVTVYNGFIVDVQLDM